MKDPVQYILVRKDLPVITQMVNVGHAAGESVILSPIPKTTVLRLLHVENEAELLRYFDILHGEGFPCCLVHEPDAPYNGSAMALGTAPIIERVNKLGKLLFHLKRAEV